MSQCCSCRCCWNQTEPEQEVVDSHGRLLLLLLLLLEAGASFFFTFVTQGEGRWRREKYFVHQETKLSPFPYSFFSLSW